MKYIQWILFNIFLRKTQRMWKRTKKRDNYFTIQLKGCIFFIRKYNCLPSNARHQHTVHPHEIVQLYICMKFHCFRTMRLEFFIHFLLFKWPLICRFFRSVSFSRLHQISNQFNIGNERFDFCHASLFLSIFFYPFVHDVNKNHVTNSSIYV